jgi:hypothetical protein
VGLLRAFCAAEMDRINRIDFGMLIILLILSIQREVRANKVPVQSNEKSIRSREAA